MFADVEAPAPNAEKVAAPTPGAAKLAQEFNDPLTTLPQQTNQVTVRLIVPRIPRCSLLPFVQLIRPSFSVVTVPEGKGSATRTEFGRAWRTTCKEAGVVAGRKAGGYTFHGTRHSAATSRRAGGLEEADAMKITGHQTSHVFRHYDIGDVDALRARLAHARRRGTVTPLRDTGEQNVSG